MTADAPPALDVLYLTHNGIADHIGQSQIAPYCLRLAERGYRIHILSVEKPGREELKDRYRRLFTEARIRWTTISYHNRPQLVGQFYDLARMRSAALRIAKAERPRMVHCRSYLPITVGVDVKRRFGAKLLIDFRHFWVEAGLAESRFPFVYRAFKRWEPGYFAAADHVVTLTDRAARILDGWYPSRAGLDRFTVIPCCADFDHFDLGRVEPQAVADARRALRLHPDDHVLLYLGSLGPAYLLDEMMAFFAEFRRARPDAKFLFVSNNGEDAVDAARAAAGIPADAIRFVTAARDAIPAYLALADMSVMFFRPDVSLAGCSPTKLAELLACDVPVVANAGVGDLDAILSFERNASLVVDDFAPATMRAAIDRILAASAEKRARIRAASTDYSLDAGARRYAGVYEKLIGPPAAIQPAPAPETIHA